MATEPIHPQEAAAARAEAERRLVKAQAQRGKVATLRQRIDDLLEENHFSLRVAKAFGLEDDRQ